MSSAYDLKSVRLPYLSGKALEIFASLAEGPLRGLLMPSLFESAGLNWMRKQNFEENPTFFPVYESGALHQTAGGAAKEEIPQAPSQLKGFQFTSAYDYAQAYRDGNATPEEVAQKTLQAITESDSTSAPLRAFISVYGNEVMRQARESMTRIKAGKALSMLDGVPVAVKDEMDMTPYPTTVGTAFLGKEPAQQDSTVVARLREAGALLIGKTNMHEIGINVTGLNPHHGVTRNPYNVNHFTGGSSSGSATAVAAGLTPIAIGADGGGSIRIPAAFCGVVGLKPTFGRVSEFGAFPLDWSVAHIGPLAASATDAALAYAIIAGPDPKDPHSLHQPLPTLQGWNNLNLKGLRLGIYRAWFEHADKEIVSACQSMLEAYQSMGAQMVEVEIPNLEANRVAHSVIILSEMAQAMDATYAAHHREHGLDTRVNLALARQFLATDYLTAQRIRARMMNHFAAAFQFADVILTPTTGIPAPRIQLAALPKGESDLSNTVEIMRFATAANLTGLPAISFPAGYTASGLPIGIQAMGKAWDEKTLLRLALAAEQVVERKAPQVYYKVL